MENNESFSIKLEGATTNNVTPGKYEESNDSEKAQISLKDAKKQRNVDEITIGISTNIPIIILFGARFSGKTMALVRLSRYLESKGYKVDPVRDFRPSDDGDYERKCNLFSQQIYSPIASESTSTLDFMLVKISKDGNNICQILEAPGEHYFDKDKVSESDLKYFPTYIKELKNAKVNGKKVPKTWVFIVECKWGGFDGLNIRKHYAKKIFNMFSNISADDRIILLCHKADEQSDYFVKDKPVVSKFFADIKSDYSVIFEKLNNNFFVRLHRPETFKYDFVVFSAGDFNKRTDDKRQFIEGDDMYPAALWKTIYKSVYGGMF